MKGKETALKKGHIVFFRAGKYTQHLFVLPDSGTISLYDQCERAISSS